jgi:hypothetical protein
MNQDLPRRRNHISRAIGSPCRCSTVMLHVERPAKKNAPGRARGIAIRLSGATGRQSDEFVEEAPFSAVGIPSARHHAKPSPLHLPNDLNRIGSRMHANCRYEFVPIW